MSARDPKTAPRQGDVLWTDEDGGTSWHVVYVTARHVGAGWIDQTDDGSHAVVDIALTDWPSRMAAATVLRAAP